MGPLRMCGHWRTTKQHIYIHSGVGRCQKGVGAHRHVIYLPSVKNHYKRVVFGYNNLWLFNNSHLCQFIEIVHKIINWYIKHVK